MRRQIDSDAQSILYPLKSGEFQHIFRVAINCCKNASALNYGRLEGRKPVFIFKLKENNKYNWKVITIEQWYRKKNT